MARKIKIGNLNDPRERLALENFLNFISDVLDLSDQRVWPQATTTDPNGNISGKIYQLLTYDNSGTLLIKQNTDGGTTWRTVA